MPNVAEQFVEGLIALLLVTGKDGPQESRNVVCLTVSVS
jgi:hypothetical protein